jgi:ABC-type histidine transport system ATPase subunit
MSEGYNASEDKSFRQHLYVKMEERHPELWSHWLVLRNVMLFHLQMLDWKKWEIII